MVVLIIGIVLFVIIAIAIVIGIGIITYIVKKKDYKWNIKDINKKKRISSQLKNSKKKSKNEIINALNINTFGDIKGDMISGKKELIKLADISKMVLTNNLGNEIELKRPNFEVDKRYKEVMISNVVSTAGNIYHNVKESLGASSMLLSELKNMYPNGLFTASVSYDKLSNFSDGSFSTMLHSAKGKIVDHKGFLLIGKEKINVLAGIDAGIESLKDVSNAYNLELLHTKLDQIQTRLLDVYNHFENTRIGNLINYREQLASYLSRGKYSLTDINAVQSIKIDAGNIYQGCYRELTAKYSSVADFKTKRFRGKSKIEEYLVQLDELKYLQEVCEMANEIELQAELEEIVMNTFVNKNDDRLKSLWTSLSVNCEKRFSNKMKEGLDKKIEALRSNALSLLGIKTKEDKCFFENKGILGSKGIQEAKNLLGIGSESADKLIQQVDAKLLELTNQVENNQFDYKRGICNDDNEDILIVYDEENDRQRIFIEDND